MNEQKLYAVKNDKGEYWEFKDLCGFDLGGFWELLDVSVPFTASEDDAKSTAKDHGGHVVTLIEEPEKVVVSPEEAELVKSCLWTNLQDEFLNNINLLFRSRRPEDITRLKSALTSGYTVENETKYNVKVPHTKDVWYYKSVDGNLRTICPEYKKLRGTFTEAEIEHYGLQDCEKEEVTDDGMGC